MNELRNKFTLTHAVSKAPTRQKSKFLFVVGVVAFLFAAGSSRCKAAAGRTNQVDGAEMIFIPAGEFVMGDDDLYALHKAAAESRAAQGFPAGRNIEDDNPRHKVRLSGFWMYKNVVTVREVQSFCTATGRRMPDAPRGKIISVGGVSASSESFNLNWSKGDHPMVNVTWNDAMAYAHWAHADLPTEAQWEKAARGTDRRKYPWGDKFDANKLWCSETPGYSQTPTNGATHVVNPGTHKVGELGVSPYGCTDMAGNVGQWCKDWYDANYWKTEHGADPQGPETGTLRVLRGSGWNQHHPSVLPFIYLATYRRHGTSEVNSDDTGFRCIVLPDSTPK